MSQPSFLYICILPTCSSTPMTPPHPHPPPHHNCHTPSHGHTHSGGRGEAQVGGATVFLPSCWCVSPWERLLDTHLHIGIRETHNWRPENRDEKFILRPEQESKPGENLLEPCMAAQWIHRPRREHNNCSSFSHFINMSTGNSSILLLCGCWIKLLINISN